MDNSLAPSCRNSKTIQMMTNDLNPDLKLLCTGDIRKEKSKTKTFFWSCTYPRVYLLLSTKDHKKTLQNLKVIVIDEWHELLEQGVFKLG